MRGHPVPALLSLKALSAIGTLISSFARSQLCNNHWSRISSAYTRRLTQDLHPTLKICVLILSFRRKISPYPLRVRTNLSSLIVDFSRRFAMTDDINPRFVFSLGSRLFHQYLVDTEGSNDLFIFSLRLHRSVSAKTYRVSFTD